MEKVKQITFKHPQLGIIEVNSTIPKEIMEQIGDVTDDYAKEPVFYYAAISKEDGGIFSVKRFGVIKPEGIVVGWMENQKGHKSFITVITNRDAGDNIQVYPAAIMSVVYEEL